MSKKKENFSIQTSNLIKDFEISGEETVHVLTGVNMKIKPGEFVACMGPSGSGKSTLLNIMATLEEITDGDVLISGVNLRTTDYTDHLQIRRNKTSIVFQNFALIPYLTSKENVKLPMKLRGIPEEEAEKKATGYLEQVGLFARMDHLPEELSGGEQQRVAIARALAHEPDIIFADEPTGNLDTAIGKEIIQIFKTLAKEKNLTVVMVTHDPDCAVETDRIYILQEGKVLEERVTAVKKRSSKKEEEK